MQNLGTVTETALANLSPVFCNITARTSHAPLTLGVAYRSPRVVLNTWAETHSAPLYAAMPPAFEGTFNLSAAQSVANLVTSKVTDPLNEGRSRYVKYATPNNSPLVYGGTSWANGDTKELVRDGQAGFLVSKLTGETENAQATLSLGDPNPFWQDASNWPAGCTVGDG
ncbi:hypothetical protein DL93DRAFT_1239576 [Clavulina sp. PMI_390]|nr:hypothetical protein DL93DRAFT_1239576 [Clavulina sp. PMI_390]